MITNEPDTATVTAPASLTAAAAAKVAELLAAEDDPALALRLGVRPGGCSGFQYDMYFDSVIDEGDVISETDGVKLVLDSQSAEMLTGATVDYKEHGLQGSGFAINNPNQQRGCGCGQSFC